MLDPPKPDSPDKLEIGLCTKQVFHELHIASHEQMSRILTVLFTKKI